MNRIDLIDEINKLEEKLYKEKNIIERKIIISKILNLELKIDKLDNKTIN